MRPRARAPEPVVMGEWIRAGLYSDSPQWLVMAGRGAVELVIDRPGGPPVLEGLDLTAAIELHKRLGQALEHASQHPVSTGPPQPLGAA
jgi:hypothetical protein